MIILTTDHESTASIDFAASYYAHNRQSLQGQPIKDSSIRFGLATQEAVEAVTQGERQYRSAFGEVERPVSKAIAAGRSKRSTVVRFSRKAPHNA